MSSNHSHSRLLVGALVVASLFVSATSAPAAPSASQLNADRQRIERMAQQLEDARERSEGATDKLRQTSERLDRILAEQTEARARLTGRARGMYRSGDVTFVSVLLSAATFEDFTTRWHLLKRMNEGDAEALRQLALSRVRAKETADDLLALQEESVRSAEQLERRLSAARRDLAADKAALRAFEARLSARTLATRSRAIAVQPPTKRPRGRGAWKTALASHYGVNFEGRGANGEAIGPYSMMCAHKTLPFGTLVEFEYGGKRAIAKVADRGPHVAGREFDLGPGVARVLGFEGVHDVRWRIVGR